MKKALLLTTLFFLSCGRVELEVPSDYITKHNIRVYLGKENAPNKQLVEKWIDEAIVYWSSVHGNWSECVGKIYEDEIIIRFYDSPVIKTSTFDINGFFVSIKDYYKIGVSSAGKTRDITIHELSHYFLYKCTKSGGSNADHIMFNKLKMCPHFIAYCN